MRTQHTLRIVALLLILSSKTWAHTGVTYRTSGVAHIAAALKLNHLDTLARGTTLVSCKGLTVAVRKDAGNAIEHIGLPLFPTDIKKRRATPVFDYIERAWLKHKVKTDSNDTGDDITFVTGSWNSLEQLKGCTDVNVKRQAGSYFVEWKKQGKTVAAIKAPINYDKVLGADRRELENIYLRELGATPPPLKAMAPVATASLTHSEENGVLVQKRGTHLVPEINRDLYFLPTNDTLCALLCDKRYPVKTLLNAILASTAIDTKAQMAIKFNLYANRKETKIVPLRNFMIHALRQGEAAYVGIEQEGEGIIELSLFLDNPNAGYGHVVFMRCNPAMLWTEGFTIEAEAYLYSPTKTKTNSNITR